MGELMEERKREESRLLQTDENGNKVKPQYKVPPQLLELKKKYTKMTSKRVKLEEELDKLRSQMADQKVEMQNNDDMQIRDLASLKKSQEAYAAKKTALKLMV